jgi:hypothetical protein
MNQADEPSDFSRCTCPPEELLRFLKPVELCFRNQQSSKLREQCRTRKGRIEILREYDYCIHCRCQVCHPLPVLGISHEHRIILLRLPPVLNTALNSPVLSNAQGRKQALRSIYEHLDLATHNQFFNGTFEDYYWYTCYETNSTCTPLKEGQLVTAELREMHQHMGVSTWPYSLGEPESIFVGDPEAALYQCLTLRATLSCILKLPARTRQVVLASLKQAQAKDIDFRVTPILWQIIQRAYFDNKHEASRIYEQIRNYGRDPNNGLFRPPIHAGAVPELQIALQLEQPAALSKIGNDSVFETLPAELLRLTLYYEAFKRAKGKLLAYQQPASFCSLGELLQHHQNHLDGFFWDWKEERKDIMSRIQLLLKTFRDQYVPSRKGQSSSNQIKEAKFKVSDDLLDLAASTELHQILEKATRIFFQANRPGQPMVDYLYRLLA